MLLCQLKFYCSVANVLKLFYSRNLKMFIISQSICPNQGFPSQSNVCNRGQELYQEGRNRKGTYLQTLRQDGKASQGQTLQPIRNIRKLRTKKFCNIGPRSYQMSEKLSRCCSFHQMTFHGFSFYWSKLIDSNSEGFCGQHFKVKFKKKKISGTSRAHCAQLWRELIESMQTEFVKLLSLSCSYNLIIRVLSSSIQPKSRILIQTP